MASLKLRFCQRLATRAELLQSAWANWHLSPGSPAPAELVRGLHSLAGAAGLHGLATLCGPARVLEQALLTPAAAPDRHAKAFASLMADIHQLANASAPD